MDLGQIVAASLRDATVAVGAGPADPGIVAFACTTDGEAVEATGWSVIEHRIPLAVETPMYAASLAKLVTALCVHRLAADDRLDLDATIDTWFPAMSDADDITVRHLLLHRSGLPEYHALRLVAGSAVEDRLLPGDVRRLVDSMATWFEPGTRVSYNNTNFAMAAMIVADVTGLPFERAASELVFDPSGMHGAFVRADPGAFVDAMANGYVRHGRGWHRALHGSTSVGDGGMWWSGIDLLAFGRMLLRGSRPSGGSGDPTVDAMREQVPLPDGSLPMLATGCTVAADGSWFGGLAEFTGFCAELRVYPERFVAIGAMSNRQDAKLTSVLDAIATRLGVEPTPAPAPPERRAGPAPRGTLVGVGGAPWHFRTTDGIGDSTDRTLAVDVGDLSFHLDPSGDAWTVRELPSNTAGWEDGDFVLRDGSAERARLRPIGGTPPSTDELTEITGWWWCPSAATTLRVDSTDHGLTLRRGATAAEALIPIGSRDGRWVLAAPWGLLEIDRGGGRGQVVVHRAEGVPIQQLLPWQATTDRSG
jgi:CubicO group peptidase (beta-lactamase class C family)